MKKIIILLLLCVNVNAEDTIIGTGNSVNICKPNVVIKTCKSKVIYKTKYIHKTKKIYITKKYKKIKKNKNIILVQIGQAPKYKSKVVKLNKSAVIVSRDKEVFLGLQYLRQISIVNNNDIYISGQIQSNRSMSLGVGVGF